MRRLALAACVLLTAGMLCATQCAAQQILLDKPVKAAELTLFPDLNDETVHYYLSDKPRLATDANGRPQFSFLRYVENVRTGPDEPEAREGEGGGIVHAVVALAVTDEQLRDAQRELQRARPGARIQGPVVYRSGKFGLVSSFTDTDGNLTTQVLGLGTAPILDGQKAAVSIQLTKLGAKILWESFKTAAPDISFSFEMDVDGFRSPKRALIEANFDQIYEHKAFGAGIASQYLAAEIKAAFEDLTRQGVIKVTQVGEDVKLEELLGTAYNKIVEMMFQPLGGGAPSLASLGGVAGAGGPSLLDRATRLLADSRAEARRENERIRREGRETETRPATPRTGTGGGATGGTTPPAGGGATGGGAAGGTTPPAGGGATGGGTPATGDAERPAAGDATPAGPHVGPGGRAAGARTPTREQDVDPQRISHAEATAEERRARERERETVPSLAIVAAFEMKRIRQRGIFRIDLNKYTTDSLSMRFDENIGDMSRYMDDERHFRQVNLDDPLFRQRELVVFVDGLNAQDFGQYINFVTVQMRKRHARGDVTDDEVRIDRNNFNAEGNNFKLLYGWKNDNDRRRWLEYDYRTVWSFFGGHTLDEGWQTSTTGAVNLAPPLQRRTVELEAAPDLLEQAEVRLVTVSIYYRLGAAEQVRQATLNPGRQRLSERVEFVLPTDQLGYEYEIIWRLRGNRTVSSGRQSSAEAVLFCDELPTT